MTPPKTLEAFRKGKLEMFCPLMEVRQEASARPITHTGSGMIRQTPKGQLAFRLLASETLSDEQTVKRILSGGSHEPGKLIPGDSYYSLSATDVSGWTWASERLQIDLEVGPGGSCIFGDVPMLEHTEAIDSAVEKLTLEFFTDVKIPCNRATETSVQVAERDPRWAIARNIAQVDAGPYRFLLEQKSDTLIVSVVSGEGALSPSVAIRVAESLQLITARSLMWAIMQKRSGGVSTTCLRSPDAQHRTALSPPVDYRGVDITGNWVWPLFSKYFQHVLGSTPEHQHQMHPISGWLRFARRASSGSIFAKGLGLSIAVEGLLEAEFSAVGEPSSDSVSAIREIASLVRAWKGDQTVRARALGAVEAMLQTRAKDRLRSLLDDEIIRREQFDAWDAIRNKAAHARPPERAEWQEWISNCYKVEVLLYHLVFHAIGHEGQFTDYGAAGWPMAAYPIRGPAGEEQPQS